MRRVITLLAQCCMRCGMGDWRQSAYNVRQLKRLWRAVQNKKRSKAQSDELKAKNAAAITQAHEEFLTLARHYPAKAQQALPHDFDIQLHGKAIPSLAPVSSTLSKRALAS